MKSIYTSQKDMLEICQDGDKYFLRYPTFNITCPEVIREIPKEAADSYMSGEHDGEELINYANFGFWKSKKSPNTSLNLMTNLASPMPSIHGYCKRKTARLSGF